MTTGMSWLEALAAEAKAMNQGWKKSFSPLLLTQSRFSRSHSHHRKSSNSLLSPFPSQGSRARILATSASASSGDRERWRSVSLAIQAPKSECAAQASSMVLPSSVTSLLNSLNCASLHSWK